MSLRTVLTCYRGIWKGAITITQAYRLTEQQIMQLDVAYELIKVGAISYTRATGLSTRQHENLTIAGKYVLDGKLTLSTVLALTDQESFNLFLHQDSIENGILTPRQVLQADITLAQLAEIDLNQLQPRHQQLVEDLRNPQNGLDDPVNNDLFDIVRQLIAQDHLLDFIREYPQLFGALLENNYNNLHNIFARLIFQNEYLNIIRHFPELLGLVIDAGLTMLQRPLPLPYRHYGVGFFAEAERFDDWPLYEAPDNERHQEVRALPLAAPVNNGQSTHTTSVHRSVSVSAKKLYTQYHNKIDKQDDLESIIQQIKEYVSSQPNSTLPNNTTVAVAFRCINRLTATNYVFTDTDSGVSIRQLLALCWIAMHDNKNRQCSLEDAKQQFLQGLYEIQRGYNLSDSGVDNGAERDVTICTSGTFNKLVNAMQGIHPYCSVIFVSSETIRAKFPLIVKEKAVEYLQQLNYTNFYHSIEKLKEEQSVEPIWNNIKDSVASALKDEFGDACDGQSHLTRLMDDLIEFGGSVTLDDHEITKIKAPSSSRQMFRAYQQQQRDKQESGPDESGNISIPTM